MDRETTFQKYYFIFRGMKKVKGKVAPVLK
jgi:hypothetical protein